MLKATVDDLSECISISRLLYQSKWLLYLEHCPTVYDS